jgi:hypothetical protein
VVCADGASVQQALEKRHERHPDKAKSDERAQFIVP